MSAVSKVDKQITEYLMQLNLRQKKAVLTVVETFAKERVVSDIWEDKTFLAELDRRTSEYEGGKAKVLTLDQLVAKVRAAYMSRGKKA